MKTFTQFINERMSDGYDLNSIAAKHKVKVAEIERELKIGLGVEKEHTNDQAEARKIAMDHLVEDPAYYTKLLSVGL